MDNKKWYKKIATIFWWTLTFLPLLIALIYFIGYHLTFNSGIATATELASYHENIIGTFETAFINSNTFFSTLTISYLETMFTNLFDILGVTENQIMGAFFGYMLSVQMYHLLFDCLVFFIHLLHSYTDCERWQR